MSGEMIQFLASLTAIVAIVAMTYLLGYRQGARLAGEDEARELFRLAPGGFEPAHIGIDAEGQAAIAKDFAGRLGVLVPHGNQFVFRLLAPRPKMLLDNGNLVIPGLADLKINLGDQAADWAVADIDDSSG